MTIQGCRCKKIKSGGSWMDREAIPSDLVSAAYCPFCLDLAVAEIKMEIDHADRQGSERHSPAVMLEAASV